MTLSTNWGASKGYTCRYIHIIYISQLEIDSTKQAKVPAIFFFLIWKQRFFQVFNRNIGLQHKQIASDLL